MRERILQLNKVARTVAICAMLGIVIPIQGMDVRSQLEKGRSLFYNAVQEEAKLDSAMALYKDLAESSDSLQGRAIVYLGALTSLKGKHAFLPQKKVRFVNEGIETMEKGIALSPDDIEALFIYGSTLYYLPFFFGEKNQARDAFDHLIQMLPWQYQDYDPELMQNILAFLREHADLSAKETVMLENLQSKVST